MKRLCFLVLMECFLLPGYTQSLGSGVFHAPELSRKRKMEPLVPVLSGKTDQFRLLEAYYVTASARFSHLDQNHDVEELVIVTDGSLLVSINDDERVVHSGEVALILPGDRHSIENADDNPVTYFLVTYATKDPLDLKRIETAGSSGLIKPLDGEAQLEPYGRQWIYPQRPTMMSTSLELQQIKLLPENLYKLPSVGQGTALVLVFSGSFFLQSLSESPAVLYPGDLALLEMKAGNEMKCAGKVPGTFMVVGLGLANGQ